MLIQNYLISNKFFSWCLMIFKSSETSKYKNQVDYQNKALFENLFFIKNQHNHG